jgi:hypothetical protein
VPLQPGDQGPYNRHGSRLQAAVSLPTVRLEACSPGRPLVVPVTALAAPDAHTCTPTGDAIANTPEIRQMAEADWADAQRRARLLASVAPVATCPPSVVQQAAAEVGCSGRHLSPWLRASRARGGPLRTRVPPTHAGGPGKGRRSAARAAIHEPPMQEA